ncbi:MAG: hypothetical protein K6U12_00205 [Armatimonadetes bacterium]|nr:hypothetical protein [Armatimonadota bacterium]CUU36768.1 hypothetical protein DCOP10_118186 [Armatimonadetes bacterium DC]
MPKRQQTSSVKRQVLEALFQQYLRTGDPVFDNDAVKAVCHQLGFGNPFDATKVDTKSELPDIMVQNKYCVAHIGKGKHQFVQALSDWYHDFEPIQGNEQWEWRYRSSLLNDLESGESSTLSLAFNQRILHDFLYEDITASPRIYIPGRPRLTMSYRVGSVQLQLTSQQMEVDLTLEHDRIVTVVEAKNSLLSDFAIYQIFHPFKYYSQKLRDRGSPAKEVNACYVLRSEQTGLICVRMYLYRFLDEDRIDSIQLVRKAEYRLVRR